MTEPGGETIQEPAPSAPPRTIDEMLLFVTELIGRCQLYGGDVSRKTTLVLNARDVAGLDAIAKFFSLVSPHRAAIIDIVRGSPRRRRA